MSPTFLSCTALICAWNSPIFSNAASILISPSVGICSVRFEYRSTHPDCQFSRLLMRSRFMFCFAFSSIVSESMSISWNSPHAELRLESFFTSSSVICTSNLESVVYISSSGAIFASIDGESRCSSRRRSIDALRCLRSPGVCCSLRVSVSNLSCSERRMPSAFWLSSPSSLFCHCTQWFTSDVLSSVQSIWMKLIVLAWSSF